MKDDRRYQEWLDGRSRIELPADFSSKVMESVAGYEEQKAASFFYLPTILRCLTANPATQAVFVVAGVIIGILRILFVLYIALAG